MCMHCNPTELITSADRVRRAFPEHDEAELLRFCYPDATPAFQVPPATVEPIKRPSDDGQRALRTVFGGNQ